MGKVIFVFWWLVLLIPLKAAAQLYLRPVGDTGSSIFSKRILPQNFYNQHLPFFCKKEAQLQRWLALPLFIRLGRKEDADYWERKPNAVKLPW